MTKYVTYLRVSTKRQGESGLGLEAQREAASNYVARTDGEIVREYVEVESGKKNDRPELTNALAHAKRAKAIVLVARLDRLSRSVAFLSSLIESGCEFVCADMPELTTLTAHVLAAVAQHEREMISKRTKAALAAAKKRGTKLGSHRPGHWAGREDRRRAGQRKAVREAARKRITQAIADYADLEPVILDLRQQGLTLKKIAAHLNEAGHTTRSGKPFRTQQIVDIIRRSKTCANQGQTDRAGTQ